MLGMRHCETAFAFLMRPLRRQLHGTGGGVAQDTA